MFLQNYKSKFSKKFMKKFKNKVILLLKLQQELTKWRK